MRADLSVIVLQLAVPVALLAWLALAPARNLLTGVAQAAFIGAYLFGLFLVPVWLVLPWWTPHVFLIAAIALAGQHVMRGRVPVRPFWPTSGAVWALTALLLPGSVGLAVLDARALAARAVSDAAVDLRFPFDEGTYLVVSGGSAPIVNAHFLTLNPKTDRQRAYRGQSYAVDLVRLGRLGLRASGWRPRDPGAYAILGAQRSGCRRRQPLMPYISPARCRATRAFCLHARKRAR